MPDVLVLCEYASLNGGERSLLTVLEHGLGSRFNVRVAAPAAGPLAASLRTLGIPHVPLELHAREGHRLELAECRCRLQRVLDAVRPDLLHANSLSMSRLSGPLAAAARLPSLGHLRDIVRINRRTADDLNCHTRLIAVSAATRGWYADLGLNAQRVHVVHNGVDLQRFRPRPATGDLHRELNLPPDALLVGSVGQIGMRKGLDTLLAAARRIAGGQPDAHFLIVGQRYSQKREAVEYEAALHAVASQPPLAGRVHFLGLRDDMPGLLNELALLVHAARQEPLGRVLLEAAASAVPVIATAVGGTAEIFPGGEAVLVPPDDAEAIVVATQNLLADSAARGRLARAARQRAETAFDSATAARALIAHYEAVLQTALVG
jgi:glycosyltransferase involved in cell wall biosynthesis